MVFTRKGLIAKCWCGNAEQKWGLFHHNTKVGEKFYDSFEDCLQDVYPATIKYYRPPTQGEIRFGEGGTHHRTFNIVDVVKPNGAVKKWFKCKEDGLRYYI
jgi:hypothetical protein